MRTQTPPRPATSLWECQACALAVEVQGARKRLKCRHCQRWLTRLRVYPPRAEWTYPPPVRRA
jgi:hypothetical protein